MTEKRPTKRSGPQGEDNLDLSQTKKHFTEPKLTFIEPKLTKYGDAAELSTGVIAGGPGALEGTTPEDTGSGLSSDEPSGGSY